MVLSMIIKFLVDLKANWLEFFFIFTTCSTVFTAFVIHYGEQCFPAWLCHLMKYGRANEDAKKTRLIRAVEVPKSWFAHFYVYAVCLQISVFSTLLAVYTSPSPMTKATRTNLSVILNTIGGPNRLQTIDATTTVLASLLFLFQVSRRLYENWFVSIFSGTKMNIIHYVVAFGHYTGCIFAIVAHSPGFSITSSDSPVQTWKLCYKYLDLMHVAGILMFLYGSVEQFKAHKHFADLRREKEKKDSVSLEHRIPHGGLFEKVSCPNYFAEILIYISFAQIFGFSNPTWNLILVWVILNQTTAGIMSHKWYLSTFPDYPKERKAVIPYLV